MIKQRQYTWDVIYYANNKQFSLNCQSVYFKNEGTVNVDVNGKNLLPGEAFSIERQSPDDYCTTPIHVTFANTAGIKSISVVRINYVHN